MNAVVDFQKKILNIDLIFLTFLVIIKLYALSIYAWAFQIVSALSFSSYKVPFKLCIFNALFHNSFTTKYPLLILLAFIIFSYSISCN